MVGVRLAYADPPYPGQADRYRDGAEVDLTALIEELRTYDGWALSTSAAALRIVWNLAPEARCAAWCKSWARNGWSRIRWSWEPVLFVTARPGLSPGERSTVWDSLVCAPRFSWSEVPGKGGGAKPYDFVRWMLDLVGYSEGDELVDLFPGSHAVSRSVAIEKLELW